MNIIIVIIIIIIVIVLLLSFINTKQNIDGSLAGSNYNESIMSEYSNYNKYNQNYQKQNKNIQLNKYFNKVQFDQDYTDVLNAITLLTQNSKQQIWWMATSNEGYWNANIIWSTFR